MRFYLRRQLRYETRWKLSYESSRVIGVGSLNIHAFGLRLECYWTGEPI